MNVCYIGLGSMGGRIAKHISRAGFTLTVYNRTVSKAKAFARKNQCGYDTSIKEACDLRFRPIMMTSISTMIAMIPLVIGNIGPGAGESSRLAVGATILGGMIISTFFTLYVTPTMYLALAKNTKRIDSVDIELKKQLR